MRCLPDQHEDAAFFKCLRREEEASQGHISPASLSLKAHMTFNLPDNSNTTNRNNVNAGEKKAIVNGPSHHITLKP